MKTGWVAIAGVVIAVFLLIIVVVPFFVSADSFRPTVESKLSAALGRTVTIGRLTSSLLGGTLIADDIAIADDPSFSSVPFIQAKKLDVGVEMLPLLLHREVNITDLTIDSPSIQLIQHTAGKWNFSSLGGASKQSSAQSSGSLPDLSVSELKITNGSATVSSIPVTVKPFQYSDLNLTVKGFSFLKSFPFELSAKLPAGGTLKLTGDAGPISQADASQTPFQAKLELREFDPVAAGVIDRSKGISMVDDIDAQMKSDGVNVTSTGHVKASRLQLSPKGTPSQVPVEIDYSVADNLNTRKGAVSDIAIHAGSAAVHVNGGFEFTPEALMLNLHLSAPSLPIDQLERLLPAVGIRLPSGSSLQGGTLTASIEIRGPATATSLSGPVEVDNTKLAGFDLGSRIQGLTQLAGTSAGTEIQVLRAKVDSTPQITKITDIYGNLPQLGSATGQGTVAPSGAIDFDMTAKLNSSNPVGALANNAVNQVGNMLGSLLHQKTAAAPLSSRGIPLKITGSATSPSIRANVGALLR